MVSAADSRDDRALIERFEAAYNSIDLFGRAHLKMDNLVSFSRVMNECVQRRMIRPRDRELLTLVAELRNLIVHRKTEPNSYVAVPSLKVVEGLEALRDRLTRPLLARAAFRRKVECVSPGASLSSVLELVRTRNVSQVPVYEGRAFRGLLTTNGMARWLAGHAAREKVGLVDIDEATAGEVLQREEAKGKNCLFAPAQESAYRVRQLFVEHELLEAVLITESGKPAEAPLGIATRWDLLRLAD
jgi:CBS domain-containing protein